MDATLSALAFHRFGLGPRPGDLAATVDTRAALEAEIALADAARLADPKLSASAATFAAIRADQKQRAMARVQKATLEAAGSMNAAGSEEMTGQPPGVPRTQSPASLAYTTEIQARLEQVQRVSVGFVERLVTFWANHFAVQVQKDEMVRGLAGAFEREAIRPHVLGRFDDMVLAATQHPAMLRSLDNALSAGPDSNFGKAKQRGLNENHARELMELHTVGVDGGYTQADVTSLARVLTGWTIEQNPNANGLGEFVFRQQWHEPGPQTVMGKVYAAGGIAQGQAALLDLAHHPATAKHVTTKFVRAFVSDDPDPGLVDRLTRVFKDTHGDLRAFAVALIEDDRAWVPKRTKLKSPQEFLWSAVRGLSLTLDAQLLLRSLRDLGQAPWDPPSPAGFPTDTASWLAPDGLTTRVEIAERLASLDKSSLDPRALLADLLGPQVSAETQDSVLRAESRQQAIALLIMSPEFQRR